MKAYMSSLSLSLCIFHVINCQPHPEELLILKNSSHLDGAHLDGMFQLAIPA